MINAFVYSTTDKIIPQMSELGFIRLKDEEMGILKRYSSICNPCVAKRKRNL